MVDIVIKKKNEVYLEVICEPHIKYELNDYFTFEVPNAKFMPQVKNRIWDGKIRLFSPGTGELYAGLINHLKQWADEHEYKYEFQDNKFYGHPEDSDELVTPEGVKDFVDSIAKNLKVREYQYKAIYESLKNYRKIILSPTGSGKSLMIYSVVRFLANSNNKTLIIVPTVSLVSQLYKDFIDYGWDAENYCHLIYSGKEKLSDAPVVITTWQSIYKLPKKYFDSFTAVIGDEVHTFKSKSLTSIMTKLHEAKYRIGFTGTLDGTQTHRLVLEGLFGTSDKIINTSDLIKQGHLSNLKIKILILKHEYMSFDSYADEMDYIVSHEGRNRFIKNLVKDLSGNTLVLFNYVDKHGKPLFDIINKTVSDNRRVFFVHGGVEADERESIREITEKEENAIIVASYGTFSTGINIKNLHNVIFASPSKSRIRNLQSIGRVLRRGENKSKAVLYDISDDISRKNKLNYTLRHLKERIEIYNEESFDYEIIPVNIKTK